MSHPTMIGGMGNVSGTTDRDGMGNVLMNEGSEETMNEENEKEAGTMNVSATVEESETTIAETIGGVVIETLTLATCLTIRIKGIKFMIGLNGIMTGGARNTPGGTHILVRGERNHLHIVFVRCIFNKLYSWYSVKFPDKCIAHAHSDHSPPEKSPPRSSLSPSRKPHHSNTSRPHSRSKSVTRSRSRERSLPKQQQLENKPSELHGNPRDPLSSASVFCPPALIDGREEISRDNRSASPRQLPRGPANQRHYPEPNEHHTGSVISPGAEKEPEVEMKPFPRSNSTPPTKLGPIGHNAVVMKPPTTEQGKPEAELAVDVQMRDRSSSPHRHSRGSQQRPYQRSPPRGPRHHTKTPAELGSPAQFHQSDPSVKPDWPSRKVTYSSLVPTHKGESAKSSDLPVYKPNRLPAVDAEVWLILFLVQHVV